MKRPFPLPLRSRQWIIDYVMNHQLYHPMNSWNGGRVLAWNIKVNMRYDQSGQIGERGEPVEPRFDARWEAHLDTDAGYDLFHEACENALRYYTEDALWTPWPGPGPDKAGKTRWEQGQFKFTVNGRSGGYLILTHWPGPQPRGWALYPMIWSSKGHLEDWLNGLSWKELRLLHEVMANLDYDLRPEAIRNEMEYQFNWLRTQWEEGVVAGEDEDLEKLEASRPDLYNHETA